MYVIQIYIHAHPIGIFISGFSTIRHFLPNSGRMLPAMTSNGLRPLNIGASRILPDLAENDGIMEKFDKQLYSLHRALSITHHNNRSTIKSCRLSCGYLNILN